MLASSVSASQTAVMMLLRKKKAASCHASYLFWLAAYSQAWSYFQGKLLALMLVDRLQLAADSHANYQ